VRVQWYLFYKSREYYPEILHPLVTASIRDVKTIRTLRSDAPLTVSDMKGSYLPDEAISRLGKAAPRLSQWIAPDPIRTPLDAVPQRLGRGSSDRGRLDDSLAAADEALRRTERSDGFRWMLEALRVKGEALLLSDQRTRLQRRTISGDLIVGLGLDLTPIFQKLGDGRSNRSTARTELRSKKAKSGKRHRNSCPPGSPPTTSLCAPKLTVVSRSTGQPALLNQERHELTAETVYRNFLEFKVTAFWKNRSPPSGAATRRRRLRRDGTRSSMIVAG
jgi:hypothetical protein